MTAGRIGLRHARWRSRHPWRVACDAGSARLCRLVAGRCRVYSPVISTGLTGQGKPVQDRR